MMEVCKAAMPECSIQGQSGGRGDLSRFDRRNDFSSKICSVGAVYGCSEVHSAVSLEFHVLSRDVNLELMISNEIQD